MPATAVASPALPSTIDLVPASSSHRQGIPTRSTRINVNLNAAAASAAAPAIGDAAPARYGGWEDLAYAAAIVGDSGKVDLLSALLADLGIRQWSQGALFSLGFISAFAVSRVRVSPVALFPVSLLVFATGFAVGVARDSTGKHDSSETSREFRAILGEIDAALGNLRETLVGMVDLDSPGNTKVRNCFTAVEFSKIKLRRARELADSMELAGSGNREKKLNNKRSSERTVAIADIVSDLGKHLGSMIQENLVEFGSAKHEPMNKKEMSLENANLSSEAGSASASSKVKDDALIEDLNPELSDKVHFHPSNRRQRRSGEILPYDDEADHLNFLRSTDKERGTSEKMFFKQNYGKKARDGFTVDDFQNGFKSPRCDKSANFFAESNESSLLERTLEVRNRSFKVRIEHNNDDGTNESAVNPDSVLVSETNSSGMEFDQCMKEASDLLKSAKECISDGNSEIADSLLYKSARVLSTAVALKPDDILAVGQLGNAYLLHGELKLKVSRQLRILLSGREGYVRGDEHALLSKNLGKRFVSREHVASVLIDVCEECENLLIEAGRKYRLALSIDGSDVKALYNWGLALSFRGQLIADIGPEAALDADKVYMAAIDKFDAMLSKSNTYAPEALYRWGVVLHHRSHLLSQNKREKVRLLKQAKSMFEDVLFNDTGNQMARDALSSCISDLNYHGRWP